MVKTDSYPLEDRALKMGAQFFGTELLPLLGVPGRVKRIAPTEQVHLEVKDFLEDFNFEMEDGTWSHFEFESDSITKEDLRRFRSYEAVTAYYYGVEVVTNVICTAETRILLDELHQGINTYKVRIIRMKDKVADQVIEELEEKQKDGSLTKQELAHLLLTPLMSGAMSQTVRIERALRVLKMEQDVLGKDALMRMEAVLYAFAMKFLSNVELEELQEVFNMTILGQMLEEKGVKKGLEQGIEVLVRECLVHKDEEDVILDKLQKYFSLNREAAKKYYDRYVVER